MHISKDLALVSADLPTLAMRLGATCEQEARLMQAFFAAMADGIFSDTERRELELRTQALIMHADALLRALAGPDGAAA